MQINRMIIGWLECSLSSIFVIQTNMIRHQNSAIRNHKWPSSEPPKPEKKEMNAFDNPIEV